MSKFQLFWLCVSICSQNAHTAPFDYPAESMVRLSSPSTQSPIRNYCTGIILNSAYILTHANCSKWYGSKPVNVAIAFINTLVSDNVNGTKSVSVKLHVHQFRNSNPDQYDVMLLELMDTYIRYDPYIHPAALYFGQSFRVFEGHVFEECAAMGWLVNGTSLHYGFYMHSLFNTNITVLSDDLCSNTFPALQNVICVKSSTSICDFELGSALVCGSHTKWVFMGYYTGHRECSSFRKIFAFRKYYFVSDWMNTTSNGVYALENDILNERVMLATANVAQGRVNGVLSLIGLSIWISCQKLINNYLTN